MTAQPTVTIIHSLPGRLRVRLSCVPGDVERFEAAIGGHAGLAEVRFTRASRSVLVRFDPRELGGQEVAMRIALALSLDRGERPVALLEKPPSRAVTDVAAYSGLLIATALLAQWLQAGRRAPMLARLAAYGTGLAVVQHAWRETREQGVFDPEVLSLAYLLPAVFRGDYLRGALITWAITFGRHLLGAEAKGVEVRPVRTAAGDNGAPRYELTITPKAATSSPAFGALQQTARLVMTASGATHAGLIEELREVSRAHGEMVEGLGWMRHDIPMRFG
jgi:hypothetical protein